VSAFGHCKKELKIFLENSLNKNEKEILLNSYELRGQTFSFVVRALSLKYSESTIKTVLKRLKKFNLLDFGDFENRGKPFSFTELGMTFFNIIDEKNE
jgi:predicted transcriptional regulator